MGLEGVENLTDDDVPSITEADIPEAPPAPTHGTQGFQKLGESNTDRPSDQEIAEQRESELQAARDEHNAKTGGGAHPLSSER